MDTIVAICAIVIAVWCVAACVVAVVVARSIRIADERMLAEADGPDEVRRPGTTSSTTRRR